MTRPRSSWPRLVRLVATMAACGSLVASATAAAATPRASLPDIEDEVMCTICGTLLELSDSPQAERERVLIRRLIDEGQTKGQIKDRLAAEYGPEVLATPTDSGFDLTAWLVPGLAIAIAMFALLVAATRLRHRRGRLQDEPPLDPGEAARLDRDLSSYDL